jgi:hypothetical protein
METGGASSGIFPSVRSPEEIIQNIVHPETKGNWLRAIMGRWPGNETIEELLADLKK